MSRGRLFVDFSPRLLYNILIKQRRSNAMTDKERKDTQKAVLYDLRCLLKNSGKKSYETEELLDLLDTIAMAKDQEA